ncbi:MAG: tRNA-intron lyase [Candidatus Bathyarchaeia archaeon]
MSENTELKIEGLLKEQKVLVSSLQDIKGLTERGYGVLEDATLLLNACEALFLLSKGLLEVKSGDKKKNLNFEELLQHFQKFEEDIWVKYLIYRDLRSRGYVVREGFGLGIDFRLYERGEYGKETATYVVYGILEGKPVKIEHLIRTLKHVQNLKKKLILAVINRRGEIVYYSLSELTVK